MTPRCQRVDVVEQDGVTVLCWDCQTCGFHNERDLYGRPWFCESCGQIDRDVEADAERVHWGRSE